MTNEEAIKVLKHNKPISDPRLCGIELCDACDIAIEALEKQVPKNPVKGRLYFECANCGETRIDYRYFPLARPNMTYCASCGQAILWEDE